MSPTTFPVVVGSPIPPSLANIKLFPDSYGMYEKVEITAGYECQVLLPDGTRIQVDEKGNFVINDKDAKVVYKGNRMREFNKFLNASDLLEEFVDMAGEYGVRQAEFMNLPMQLFINWLVIKAAEADGDPVQFEEIRHSPLLTNMIRPRCLHCGRFLEHEHRRRGVNFCSGAHLDAYLDKTTPKAQFLPMLEPPKDVVVTFDAISNPMVSRPASQR